MKTKKMAFWKYDLFPYLLWGEVSNKHNEWIKDGVVLYYVEAYQGYIRPLFMLPLKEGKELSAKIEKLKHDKRKADNDIYTKYVNMLSSEISGAGVDAKLARLPEVI